MRADGHPQEAWERLGRLLEERRGELNPDWANRAQFLRDTGMNKKLIERLELAKLDSYRPATLAKVSVAYGWTADSIRRILSGGEPQPRPNVTGGEPSLTAEDVFEERILAADLPYAEKVTAIRRHREQARAMLADLGLEPPVVPESIRRAIRAYAAGNAAGDEQESRGA
jgi:hypothetical protein